MSVTIVVCEYIRKIIHYLLETSLKLSLKKRFLAVLQMSQLLMTPCQNDHRMLKCSTAERFRQFLIHDRYQKDLLLLFFSYNYIILVIII